MEHLNDAHSDTRTSAAREPRVLIISQREVKRLLGYGPFYEFEEAIESLSDADRIDLRTLGDETLWIRTSQRANSLAALISGGRSGNFGPLPRAEQAALDRDYDVTILVCVNIFDIRLLNLVRGLRERSRKVVVFVPEQWPIDFDHYRVKSLPYRVIDHIFVGFDDVVSPISEVSNRPTSALPIGINTTRFRPVRTWADRMYDICWTGRRIMPMHETLLRMASERGWRYYFDTFSVGAFENAFEHRDWLARLLSDSRFAISHYARITQPEMTKGQRQLGGRFLESAAAGNVLVGAPPNTPQFHSVMSWPDAVIPISESETRIDLVLEELGSDPKRMEAISRRNVAGATRSNDWAHRWATVLDTVGLPRGKRLIRRLAELEAEAKLWEQPSPGSVPLTRARS